MTSAKKRDAQPQPRLFPFIIIWTIACFLAACVLVLLSDLGPGFEISNSIYFAILSTLQFFVIYRFLHVELQNWIPLAVAGAIAGALVSHAFPTDFSRDLSPQFEYTLSFLFLWGVPPLFQWAALRKRFRYHVLWLLAAVVNGPLGAFFVFGDSGFGGFFIQMLGDTCCLRYSNVLIGSAIAASLALPTLVQGLILFVVVKQGDKSVSVDQTSK